MSPSEIALHLPEWVIPNGTDLDHLRDATEQLIAEFSRPIRLDGRAPSMSRSWSYVSEGNLNKAKWLYPHNGVPRIYICSTAALLHDDLDFRRVMDATVPHSSWVVEDSLLEVFSASELFKLDVKTRRAIRLEWLKQLKEKVDDVPTTLANP